MKPSKEYPNITYKISHETKLLFIGINPSPGTYQRGIPFSNNKSFWYLLQAAGLINESHEDLQNDTFLKQLYDKKLTSVYHLGLLNLVDRPTKTVAELKKSEAIPGALRIVKAIKKYHPRVVCFVGKTTYKLFAQLPDCEYGWQPDIESTKVFVMHFPLHGLANVRIKELKEVAQASGLNRR